MNKAIVYEMNKNQLLNLDRMFASSLFILLISASLLLQFLMSEIKTARPRIESPLGAGIFKKIIQFQRILLSAAKQISNGRSFKIVINFKLKTV